ncbi:MAG: hypothetical protein PPP58_02965 [Natronomonas sp.]
MTEAAYDRIVADADVLAADLLVGGPPREALDHLRRHSWLTLVATEPLLDDAEAIVRSLSDPALAAAWRNKLDDWATVVEQPAGDHPALAAAYRSGATQLLSADERLRSARVGTELRAHTDLSVRTPAAFARLFDPAAIYDLCFEETYPGPDRDPRW